ncbi:hypothetical protein KIPB_004540 [Kipferlia bialata]|uniref:Uncharacterized protein n=1 Tax=Kipferlia bialata TaxID=797122 RepID=A0A9K3GGN2_9EUKA|nr:hypothetical protein KIPB_004540 [Kipferlia bialata]|eukprot:g4540.t1
MSNMMVKQKVLDAKTCGLLDVAGLGPCADLLYGEFKMPLDLIRKASAMMETLREYVPNEEEDLEDTPWAQSKRDSLPDPAPEPRPRHSFWCSTHTPHLVDTYYHVADDNATELYDAFALTTQEDYAYAIVE